MANPTNAPTAALPFIDGADLGTAPPANHPSPPGQMTQVHGLHETGVFTLTRERVFQTSPPHQQLLADRLVLEIHASVALIKIDRYKCLLQIQVNGQRMMLSPADDQLQPLVLHLPGPESLVSIGNTVSQPITIQLGHGQHRVQAGAGFTRIRAGTGEAHIQAGSGMLELMPAPSDYHVVGHCLVGAQGHAEAFYRNLPQDARLELPTSDSTRNLGRKGLKVTGNAEFVEAVNDSLELMRKLHCGQALLAQLDTAALRTGTPISIIDAGPHGATRYLPSTDESDESDTHYISKSGERGLEYSGGTVELNRHALSLNQPWWIDLYQRLCMAYNSVTGSVFAGTKTFTLSTGKHIEVSNWELQAIGLSVDQPAFEFEPDEQPRQSNPLALNENAIRHELGLAPRLHPQAWELACLEAQRAGTSRATPDLSKPAINIEGDDEYRGRIQALLQQLWASPTASVLLHSLQLSGATITIKNTDMLDNAVYHPDLQGDPHIRNGKPGEKIKHGTIEFNPDMQRPDSVPIVVLYHELCHAWNHAYGTVLANHERQVVGLDTGEAAFDFDNDPHTPPTDTNPAPFNENALRAELGLPARLD
ncbi:M91 family zinc metallopeptidase [Pseudomonas sp. xss_2]|uniref:M91 family zinc metallopeptidase n=1 Tax=Pseudomonas sp. xss_2 TaxID=3367215 RepID=UPI00370A639F